jgi:transglutaminase-like putative cysteine protease
VIGWNPRAALGAIGALVVVLAAGAGLRAEAQGGGAGPGSLGSSEAVDLAPTPEFVVEHQIPGADELRFQPTQGVRFLLFDRQHDATLADSPFYFRFAMQATSLAGVAQIAQLAFPYDPAYQRFEFHHVRVIRDGGVEDRRESAHLDTLRREERLEQQTMTGALTVSLRFDDVRVGDIVDIAYTVYGAPASFAGRDSRQFDLGLVVPVERAAVRTRWPRSAQWRTLGAPRELKVTRERGTMLIELEPQSVEKVELEDFVPVWDSGYPILMVADFGDWSDVADWGRAMYEVAPDPMVADLARTIEAEHADKAERLIAALRFVQQEVRYFALVLGEGGYTPTPAGRTLATRSGDCKAKTLLLLALLDELGIEGHAALVNTFAGLSLPELAPTPTAFNHVIVRARLDGRSYWFDPAAMFEGGSLANHDEANYGFALPLEHGTRELADMRRGLAPHPTTVWRETIDLRGGVSQPARVRVQIAYTGVDADIQRAYRASYDETELDETMTKFVIGRHGDAELISGPIAVDDFEANRFESNFEIEIATPFEARESERRHYFSAKTFAISRLLPTKEHEGRTWPVSLLGRPHVRHEIVFELPEVGGWELASETTAIENAAFRFTRTTVLEGLIYTVTADLVGLDWSAPADQLEAIAADEDRMMNLLEQSIWIAMPARGTLPELSLPRIDIQVADEPARP